MSQAQLTRLKDTATFLEKHGQFASASTVRVAREHFIVAAEKAEKLKPVVREAIEQLASMHAAAVLQQWPQDVKFLGNAISLLMALSAAPGEATTSEITKLVERQEQLEAAIAALKVDVEALTPWVRDINVWGPQR
jgi:DNA polymerase III delta subunit